MDPEEIDMELLPTEAFPTKEKKKELSKFEHFFNSFVWAYIKNYAKKN